MRAYSANGPNASGTTATLVTVIASTSVRPALFEFAIGSGATPADQAALIQIGRLTATGTAGSSFTPLPLDSSDVAAVATSGITHSAEPTYTANQSLFNSGLNQRATFRWVASPGMEFKCPATANNGLGLKLVSATAAMVLNGTINWVE